MSIISSNKFFSKDSSIRNGFTSRATAFDWLSLSPTSAGRFDQNHVWADADGTTPITNNAAIMRADDLSGNGNHLYASGGGRPAWRNNSGGNGIPYADFGGDNYLNFTDPIDIGTNDFVVSLLFNRRYNAADNPSFDAAVLWYDSTTGMDIIYRESMDGGIRTYMSWYGDGGSYTSDILPEPYKGVSRLLTYRRVNGKLYYYDGINYAGGNYTRNESFKFAYIGKWTALFLSYLPAWFFKIGTVTDAELTQLQTYMLSLSV